MKQLRKINPASAFLKKLLFTYLCTGMPLFLTAQSPVSDGEENYVSSFRNTLLINAPSTSLLAPRSFEFQILHRFGAMQPDKEIISNFLGMDLTADIQFRFAFPLNKMMMAGAGRSKSGKTYDAHIKSIFMRQTDDGRTPVTLGIYFNTAIRTTEFNKIAPNTFFADGVSPFKNKFNHRLLYNTQLLISKNFNQVLHVQLSPAFIYRNLAGATESNYSFAIPLGGTIRLGMRSSLLFEYAYLLNYTTENHLHPLSLGIEFGTSGHTFQVIASSSGLLHESDVYTSSPLNYDEGEFLLGFNLKRTFWRKKK